MWKKMQQESKERTPPTQSAMCGPYLAEEPLYPFIPSVDMGPNQAV